jgi:transcriptional regulator with XRE-family HTH domain
MSTFAKALRSYMDAQGLTQSEVAGRTGVAQPVIGRLLGTAQPQMPTLLRIASGLGVEIRIKFDGSVTIEEKEKE